MKLLHVDAFASQTFHGNPAAVCLLNAPAEADWMQRVGAEMNLSETAFVYPLPAEGSDSAHYHLRWFTPTIEVDLCGHATLATAHALWEEGRVAPTQQIRFETRSGTLIADRFRADGSGDWICLDFPATLSQPLDLPR
ncbi:MAG: PhzF family phenazine biosynthesis protein, partial [Prochlorotrichaceae cyanobacterium]